ncbi:MAG TPA: CHAD domain-containing protein [Steroidobacteraceae bacterium]
MAERQPSGIPVRLARDALIEQLDPVIGALQRRKQEDEAVHEARKGVKRSRAILRLLRHVIGDRAYRRENTLLRDAARPLTALRDAKVLIETLQQLVRKSAAPADRGLRLPLAGLLKDDLDRCRERLSPQRARDISARLKDVRRRIEDIDEKTLKRKITRKDMDRIYRQARTAFADARRSGTDAHLHEWRKQAKYLLNQIELVREFGVRHLAKSRRQADRLDAILGADHDLAVLKNKIRGFVAAGKLHRPKGARDEAPDGLEKRLERRRSVLQKKARRLGWRLFAGKRHLIKKWQVQTVTRRQT